MLWSRLWLHPWLITAGYNYFNVITYFCLMLLEHVNCTTMSPPAAQDMDECTCSERPAKRRRTDNAAYSAVGRRSFGPRTVESRHNLYKEAPLTPNESGIWGSQDTNELLPKADCWGQAKERDSGYSSTISGPELEDPISAEYTGETYKGSESAPAGDVGERELVCFGMVGFGIICSSIVVS